jgi:hypothetical protein
VGDLPQLPPDGGVDPGMIVSVQIGPDGRVGIKIFPPLRIPQPGAFAAYDYNRLALEPIAHLGEGVPDVTMIQFGERMHGGKV